METKDFCEVYYACLDALPFFGGALRDGISKRRLELTDKPFRGRGAELSLLCEQLLILALKERKANLTLPLRFEYSEHGKPRLSDYPDIHINLSHGGDIAVCAVCGRRVGVDTEPFREGSEAVLRRILTNSEMELYSGSADKAKEFSRLWTQKESYIKLIGGDVLMIRTIDWDSVNAEWRQIETASGCICVCTDTPMDVKFIRLSAKGLVNSRGMM